MSHYESVLNDVLKSIRSLLCVATHSTTHERFLNFLRRSSFSKSLPTCLISDGKAFFKRFVRNSKNDPYVDEVELINVNSTHAEVRYPSNHEATVSIGDFAPCPQKQNNDIRPNNKSFEEHDITLQISQIQQLVLTMKMKTV